MWKLLRCLYRLSSPVINLAYFKPSNLFRYPKFFYDFLRYKKLSKENISIFDIYPIFESKNTQQLHWNEYLIQDLWAIEKILDSGVKNHTDIGSRLDGFVCQLAVSIMVKYVDIRPPGFEYPNLNFIYGSILELPFADKSLESVSSLHVVEHIGLGRYFDELDPDGTIKALKELERVIAPGGNLYLGLPIGTERIEFNANRILHPLTVIRTFSKKMELLEFAFAPKNGKLQRNADLSQFPKVDYAIGMFHFYRRDH